MQTIALEPVRPQRTMRPVSSLRLERQLARFPGMLGRRVRAVAGVHPRVKDLALSFPGLLFALAVPAARIDPAPILARAIDGARLKELAAPARVPMWLRALPPEAFVRPLPPLPLEEDFGRRVLNHIPHSAKLLPDWLEAVALMFAWADDQHAVWIAREWPAANASWQPPRRVRFKRRRSVADRLRWIALWAWYSSNVGDPALAPAQRWVPEMQFAAANAAMARWLADVDLRQCMPHAVADVWALAGTFDGYEFVPLRTAQDISDEAQAMMNCLRNYGDAIASGSSRFWSMRQNGERVATLDLGFHFGDPLPGIMEIAQAQNAPATPEISTAARRWLSASEATMTDRTWSAPGPARRDTATWRAQWKPYWMAKRRIPAWLPLNPADEAPRCY